MQESACSWVHAFVADYRITNTNHPPASKLLRRIALFYHLGLVQHKISVPESEHLPNMDTIDGVLDLLSLCWMVIMSNVLDHQTYSAPNQDEYEDASPAELKRLEENDQNAIPQEERLNMVYAQGICYDILRWFDAHFTVEDIATGVQGDAFGLRWITMETFKLMHYKETAELQRLQGAAHCTPKMLQHQINNVMEMEITRQVWAAVQAGGISEVEYLGWSTETKGCVIVHKREDSDSEVISDFIVAGTTPLDSHSLSYFAVNKS